MKSPLDRKKIKPVNPKGNQPLIFIGRDSAEAEVPTLWPPDAKSLLAFCMCACSIASVVSDSAIPDSSVHGDSPGKNTEVGSLFLLQGIFPTQESNWGLLHCRQILYQMSYQGSPLMSEPYEQALFTCTSGFWLVENKK